MFTTDHAQNVMKKLVERFQSGDIAPLVELSRIRLTAQNSIPFDCWSFSNQFLALIQTGETDCRGFRQWQEVKRYVKKGAVASYILGPIYVKDTSGEQEKKKLVGFKSIPVFPLSMTEGEPLPDISRTLAPEKLPPLADVAHKWGVCVKYTPSNGREYGSFSPSAKSIRLASHDETVFFHELIHAGHAKIEGVVGGQNPRQETIAQFGACVLMQVYGLQDSTGDSTGFTWDYIKNYNPQNPLGAIMSVMDIVGKILDLIANA